MMRLNKRLQIGFFVFIALSLFFLLRVPYFPPMRVIEKLFRPTRIFIGIITHSSSAGRARAFWNYFSQHFLECPYLHGPFFTTLSESDSTGLNVLQISNEYESIIETYPYVRSKPRNINIMQKMLTSMKYFLEKTDDDYYLRMTDDVYINFPEIPSLLEELKEKGDPRKIPVIIGHCLRINGSTFLQGGTGYLFSRRAAEIFYGHHDQLLRVVNWYEDWVVYTLIQKIVPNYLETGSPLFNAQGMTTEMRVQLERGNYTGIQKCPKIVRGSINCLQYFIQFKKSVFYHQYGFYPKPESWNSMISKAPDNLFWYQLYLNSIPCFQDK